MINDMIENWHLWKFIPTKYPAFKTYLIYLNHKDCINIDDGKIKKSSKTISLKPEVFLEFDAIIKFYENNVLLNNK